MTKAQATTSPPVRRTSSTVGARRSPGRQQVVDDQHATSMAKRVLVDLQAVAAVFEVVASLERSGGQLARLAHEGEARAEMVRDGRADDEAARLDADDDVDPIQERKADPLHRLAKGRRVEQAAA